MPKKIDEKEEEKKEGKKVEEAFAVAEIPTQVKPMIVDTRTDEVYTMLAAVTKIMNDMEKLKDAMLGKTT